MKRSIKSLGAFALAIVLGVSAAANAQTIVRHARHPVAHPAAVGRQIIVHPRESYLTAGPGAFVGEFDRYALDTLQPPGTYMPEIDHTIAGQRGLERLPDNFRVPGCCVSLFR